MSDSLRTHGLQHARLPCPLGGTSPRGGDISQSLLKLRSTELAMPSNHLVLYHLLLLPSIFPSIRVFSSESAPRIRWLFPSVLELQLQHQSFQGIFRLIAFRIDGFDLLAVQRISRISVVVVPQDARRGQQAVNDGIQAKKDLDTVKDFREKISRAVTTTTDCFLPRCELACLPNCCVL